MLVIERSAGEGFYVGTAVRVTVVGIGEAKRPHERIVRFYVEAPQRVLVSKEEMGFEGHLSRQAARERVAGRDPNYRETTTVDRTESLSFYVGRSVRVKVMEVVGAKDGHPVLVRIGIEAPQHIAISRDDFTFQEHLKYQLERSASKPEL
jgi:sRNA-binding carbon storage regulator CsrA